MWKHRHALVEPGASGRMGRLGLLNLALFQVLLPLLASQTWHGTAATYATLTAAMGIGSVLGALATGARGRVGPRMLVFSALGFGVAELVVAAVPSYALQVAALVPLGAVSVTFAAG